MRKATVQSVCECQARLSATLDEQRFATGGAATLRGERERAPAHTIGAAKPRFDVGWLCPFCGRNTLRSFSADALVWRDEEPAPAAP